MIAVKSVRTQWVVTTASVTLDISYQLTEFPVKVRTFSVFLRTCIVRIMDDMQVMFTLIGHSDDIQQWIGNCELCNVSNTW